MSQPLDRIRQQVGIPGATRGVAAPLARMAGMPAGRPAPPGLLALRAPAVVVALLSVLAALAHRRTFVWASRESVDPGSFVYDVLVAVLGFGEAQAWAPIVAGLAAVSLVVIAVATGGFASGGRRERTALIGMGVVGAVASLPIAVAVLVGLVALAVTILVVVALIALILFVLAGALEQW